MPTPHNPSQYAVAYVGLKRGRASDFAVFDHHSKTDGLDGVFVAAKNDVTRFLRTMWMCVTGAVLWLGPVPEERNAFDD